jgi:hypothetical protein
VANLLHAQHPQVSMPVSAVPVRQTEIVLSQRTHQLMNVMQESCIAVVMAL